MAWWSDFASEDEARAAGLTPPAQDLYGFSSQEEAQAAGYNIPGTIPFGSDEQWITGPDGRAWVLAAQTVHGGITPDNDLPQREGLQPGQFINQNGRVYISPDAASALGAKYGGGNWMDTLAKMAIIGGGTALTGGLLSGAIGGVPAFGATPGVASQGLSSMASQGISNLSGPAVNFGPSVVEGLGTGLGTAGDLGLSGAAAGGSLISGLGSIPGDFAASLAAGAADSGILGSAGSAASGGIWDTFLKGLGTVASGAAGGSSGGLLNGLLGAGSALANYFGSKDLADQLKQAGVDAAKVSDPFGGERPYYQGLLKQSYTDPNFFNNNSAFTGIRDMAMDATNRKMANSGYNMSGNQIAELGRTATNAGYQFAQPWQAQVAQNAGAGISPGYAGYLQAQGANAAANTDYNNLGNLSQFGGRLLDIAKGLA